VSQHQNGKGGSMAGKHRRNPLCFHCGRAEGDLAEDGKRVTLLQDLDDYADSDRIWQGARSPDNPLPQFLVWCIECAKLMVQAGDPIMNFREFGYEDKPDDGPYAQYLRRHGRGINLQRRP
jgi:hypothetical protein